MDIQTQSVGSAVSPQTKPAKSTPRKPDEAEKGKKPAEEKDQREVTPVKTGIVPANALSAPKHSLSLTTGIDGQGVTLTDPMRDSYTNTKTVLAIGNVVGTSLELLTEKFPSLDKNVLYRIAEASVYSALSRSLMYWSHEGGHYQVAKKYGLDPSIHLTPPIGGYTSWSFPPGLEAKTQLAMQANTSPAGQNQTQLVAQEIYDQMHLGDARYYDAIDYLMFQLDASFYTALSTIAERRGKVRDADDNVGYANVQTARGQPITTGGMLLPAALAALLSANTWNSLYGALNYLVTGEKHFQPWTLKVGGLEVTPPNFSYFRSAAGEAVEGSFFINPHGNIPLKLSFASDLDFRGNGNDLDTLRFGAKLYKLTPPLPVLDHLAFNPYFYINTDHGFQAKGYLVGSEMEVKLQKNVSLIGDVGYAKDDLIASKIRFSDGVYTYAGIKVSF